MRFGLVLALGHFATEVADDRAEDQHDDPVEGRIVGVQQDRVLPGPLPAPGAAQDLEAGWPVAVREQPGQVAIGPVPLKEAARTGEKIIDQVMGRNQFWVAESLGKAYLGLNEKAKARKVLTAYLARPEAADPKMKSSKKNLEDLLQKAK